MCKVDELMIKGCSEDHYALFFTLSFLYKSYGGPSVKEQIGKKRFTTVFGEKII